MRKKIEERKYVSREVKDRLLKETNGKCAHCGVTLIKGENQTLEHFIPLNKGGRNEEDNFTVLCHDCNQFKSDMILPVDWYPYLPKGKCRVFKSLLRRYIKEVDYLAKDCVLLFDTISIKVDVPVGKKGRGSRPLCRPVMLDMYKMSSNDAFEWLMEYRASLAAGDFYGTITSPRHWPSPCYMVRKGGMEIAMVNPHLTHEWDDEAGNYHNEIVFDWFFSPKLPDRPHIPDILAGLVESLEYTALHDLRRTMEGPSFIMLTFRCFSSDRFCKPVVSRFDREKGTLESRTKYHMPARLETMHMLGIAGDGEEKSMLRAMLKKDMERSFMGRPMSMHDVTALAMNYCNPLNKRFKD